MQSIQQYEAEILGILKRDYFDERKKVTMALIAARADPVVEARVNGYNFVTRDPSTRQYLLGDGIVEKASIDEDGNLKKRCIL